MITQCTGTPLEFQGLCRRNDSVVYAGDHVSNICCSSALLLSGARQRFCFGSSLNHPASMRCASVSPVFQAETEYHEPCGL